MTEPGDGVPEAKAPNGGLVEGDATGGVACLPGRLGSHYEVGKAVGKGGYAVVYKGIRNEDGRVIAVKKVEIFEMTQKKRERCLQEVKLLGQLKHPFVIQMLDAFIDENMLIIIFEWAPAGDLKRLIKKTAEAGRTLDEASIWSFFAQITDALRYMHQHRIMHRDIKPANVLVGANGALKLADLGLGRQLSEQTMEAFSKVGTPYYVSPEVVRGAGYDWKSDVWSMGCLLYELACLKSPFEMEGANLYDVFQKISKGEYVPLPADQFSSSLRALVVRMLSVEPSQRPDLEEVWAITKKITQSQTKSRQDVHTLAEELYQQLTLMEAHVGSRNSSAPTKDVANGKKQSRGALDGQLAPPPVEALRCMHPLYLAERLGHLTAADADENQKRQLGVFMSVFSWIVKLNEKHELAKPIEENLEMLPMPGRYGGPARPPSGQPPATGSKPSHGRSSRSTKVAPTEGAAGSVSRDPSPPPSPALVPTCRNLLKGAEAVKRAAHGLGLSTEFAPVNALATGYGRAVCTVLQEALEITANRLTPVAAKPRYPAGEDGKAADGDGDDDNLPPGFGDGDENDVLSAATPLAGLEDGEEDEEELGYYMMGDGDAALQHRGNFQPKRSSSIKEREGHHPHHSGVGKEEHLRPRSADRLLSVGGSSSAPGSRTGTPTRQVRSQTPQEGRSRTPSGLRSRTTKRSASTAKYSDQIDPIAWKLELERLAPQLSKIQIKADSAAASDWHLRWQRIKNECGGISQEAALLKPPLQKLGTILADDLERLSTSERHLNHSAAALLEQYRSARTKLEQVQRYAQQQEELSQIGHNALRQIDSQLAEMQEMMQEQAANISSSTHVKNIQGAIFRLKKEMLDMDVRVGVIQQQLMTRNRKCIVGTYTWDEEDLGGYD